MNPRKDWSWKPDALVRKRLDDGNKKFKAHRARVNAELNKPKEPKCSN